MCTRARRFCLTLNNYSEKEEFDISEHMNTKHFWIIGKEVGSENNTPHLQIYFESKNPIAFKTIKNWNNRLHIEVAKGSRRANYNYCSKEGNFKTNIKEEDLEKQKKDKIPEKDCMHHYVQHENEDCKEKLELVDFTIDNIENLIFELDPQVLNNKINNMLIFLEKLNICPLCENQQLRIDSLLNLQDKYGLACS